MNGRNAPLSPVSLGGSEWSVGKHPNNTDDPYANNRGNIVSPPNSGGSNGAMNGAFPPGPRSAGGPSPPPSVGRSSNGTNLYARSESGRSIREEQAEGILGEHYVALKNYLNGGQGGKPTPANKARDKLLRLSSVQFLELSTDVFDELLRRQSLSRRPSPPGAPGPPPYLLPESNFHPKRNQARQKLSSLGPPRFRDLATDVFCELERRFPRFAAGDIPRVGSPVSVRSQATINGNGFPPRSQSRMRRPSDASSMRGGPQQPDIYGVPPSPGMPSNGDYNRPMQKQFQSNTIVPNKSTMVEEDDDGSPNEDDGEAFALERTATNRSKRSEVTERSAAASEADKKLLDEYQTQVRELREKLDAMEDAMKKKDDELNSLLDGERSRSTAANMEKKEFADLRFDLENKVAEAQDLNASLKQELNRMRDEHANEARQLREQVDELRQSSVAAVTVNSGKTDSELQMENQRLRLSLQEQQQVTEDARREAREFLREMKILSQQGGSTWQKQEELEKTIEQLEAEVHDWRNRYARTKTQLRNMRASSLGLAVEQDTAKYVREKGFIQQDGAVKDIHVTKFQIAIDELLQRARAEDPDTVIDAMKQVVVSVRRITKDVDTAAAGNEELLQQRSKLRGKISSTANHLITTSKNFASSAGITPVSLLDAAATHLVAAIVDILRVAKIRSTPAEELDDDDDGTVTPVDSTGFFSPRTASRQESVTQESLPTSAPFRGLGNGGRISMDSSAYSPVNSPRQSADAYNQPQGPNGMSGRGFGMMNQNTPANGYSNNSMRQRGNQAEDLKIYLEDQTAILVQNIQNLVGSIRSDALINQITSEIGGIVQVVDKVISETEASGNGGMIARLVACRDRLLEASERGMGIDRGKDVGASGRNDREWRMWTQTLPPIAFEIARETKELVQRVDRLAGNGDDDFS
ncbi:Protein SPA2 [Colletotrichum tanaceti]|uniref:Protein SPA2 n=1 Tax=Colletotrichum tanaceti TaxID=1306861 RepID=A0A4U6XUT1_9PEZI|nr:Protein SPA2 [Colletotrichum tanaceti]TKW59765.1 Protein SPA2 [Colletotrichum tanaceti]